MQIAKPTDDQIWNWRENVKEGIKIFIEKVEAAGRYHQEVAKSTVFKGLVSNFNKRRRQQGLKPIRVAVPPLEGEQLELDAIRGYDGWFDGLHEFRVAVDAIDGDKVLRVTNKGEVVWEPVPVAERRKGRPNYVQEVLAFRFDCTASPVVPVSLEIRAEDGKKTPCRILSLRKGASRTYRAIAKPAGGKFKWTCTNGASIVGSALKPLVTVKGETVSTHVDDVVLTVQYERPSSLTQTYIKLTVAEVKKIAVRVRASAGLAPGRRCPPHHDFDCMETSQTAKAFKPATSLILLRGNFDDVELKATVTPLATPLAWDVVRFRDDHRSLGTKKPTLQDPALGPETRVETNETGSFFVRAFGDCGDHKFDAKAPFKLVPMMLVQASLEHDDSKTHPGNPQSAASKIRKKVRGVEKDFFSVRTGENEPGRFNPSDNAIHMSATVRLVSGGKKGDRLIDRVFVGWVNNLRVNNSIAGYTGRRTFSYVLPDAHAFLDTPRDDAGAGGNSVTPEISHSGAPTKLSVGEQRTEEALDSPFFNVPATHPFGDTYRLRSVLLDMQFSAHLCLWTDRGVAGNFVARHCYGVLRSYPWQVVGEFTIDNALNPTVITPLSRSPSISGAVTHNPLAKPDDANCEICPPTAQDSTREEPPI